jgi:ribosomal protein L17
MLLRMLVTNLFSNFLIDDEAEKAKEARRAVLKGEQDTEKSRNKKKTSKEDPQPLRKKNRLVTTIDKVKAMKPLVDKVAILAKKGDKVSLLRAQTILTRGSVASRLFEEVKNTDLFKDRECGFLSYGRIGLRSGDAAVMVAASLITPDYVKATGGAGAVRGMRDRRKRVEASRKRQAELEGPAAD